MRSLEKLLAQGWTFLCQSKNSIFLENKYNGKCIEYVKKEHRYKELEVIPKYEKGKTKASPYR